MPLFTEPASARTFSESPEHRPQLAGRVVRVLPGSPADLAGIEPGDLISAVCGHPVEDVIDVQFFAAESDCVLTIERAGCAYEMVVPKTPDQQLGVVFEDDLFNGIRLCANRCDFCFVDQQPMRMRQTLQIRDDDFRLSFLHGNFCTLTNMTAYDWRRVFRQMLSPLYISVHATDIEVRKRLLRNKRHPPIMDDIHRLVDGGVIVHTQVVLCQGMNDGEVLDKTISDLAPLYPRVQTLAVVPMGVTDYRLERNTSETYGPAASGRLLKQVRTWQRRFETELGTRFVYPSDEFYLVAGQPLPKAHSYQGFPQLSNGLGGCRIFLDELSLCRKRLPREARTGRVQIVTGTLASSILQRFAEGVTEVLGYETQVVAAVNHWYGASTTVAGLLTGRDVKDALNRAGRADLALVPKVMLREDADVFLDDMTVEDVSAAVGRPVLAVPDTPHAAIEALRSWQKPVRPPLAGADERY